MTERTIEDLKQLSSRLEVERSALLDYLMAKYHNEDWHAVQDAASDLRDIDCKISVIEKVLE